MNRNALPAAAMIGPSISSLALAQGPRYGFGAPRFNACDQPQAKGLIK